jgi:transposase
VVVVDNLWAHKGERIRELIESAGCELLYLPPYFLSDLSPIEEAFSRRSKVFSVRHRPQAGKR